MELRPWTLPNLLTFARLVALPFLIIAIVEGEQMQAFAIFFAMAVSDFVDGYLARHFGMASPLGALLDPIADKLLLVSTFIVFALKSTPTNIHIPLWLVLMTVGARRPDRRRRPRHGARASASSRSPPPFSGRRTRSPRSRRSWRS